MRRTLLLSFLATALVVIALFLPRGQAPVAPRPEPPRPDLLTASSRGEVGSPITLRAAFDHGLLAQAGPGRADLALELEALARRSRERGPLHLALVLDRSGSMAGDKMEQARRAAREMIARLEPRDSLALVAYDSRVDVLVPLTSLAEGRARLLAAVEGIVPDGGTNLGEGLQEGLRELRRQLSPQALHRVLLISDGQANEGVTDAGRLGAWVAEARSGGVALSTLGVGLDYNEDLMIALAQQGGGGYYFAEDAASLAKIFARELESLLATVARGATVTVEPLGGAQVEKVLGFPSQARGQSTELTFGDLASGERRQALVELRVPVLAAGVAARVQLRLRYQDATREGAWVEEVLRLQLGVSPDAAQVAASEDRGAQELAQTVRSTEVTREALRLYEVGRVEEAQSVARRHAQMLEGVGRRIRSQRVQEESRVLQRLEEDMRAAPDSSSVDGKGLRKRSKARAWDLLH